MKTTQNIIQMKRQPKNQVMKRALLRLLRHSCPRMGVCPGVHHHLRRGRLSTENVIKMTPGPTRYAISRVDDIKSCLELFTVSIDTIIMNMTNLEGRRVYEDNWKEVDRTDIEAYMGLLILSGVYRSCNESTSSLWDAESGQTIFRATMSLQTFHVLSQVIRFDNRDTRPGRRQHDKLAAIREVWDKWVERLPLIYNPSPDITVDERLVVFRGRCPFKQYMPSKPSKYGIKIWAACDARTSYAWNMQVYTGKSADGVPEKNEGKRVVLEMTAGLRGHKITCDNFFTSYALGQELLQKRLTMVGTVRKNKPELPPALLNIKDRDRFFSKFAFTNTHALVSYCPQKKEKCAVAEHSAQGCRCECQGRQEAQHGPGLQQEQRGR